MCMYNDKNENDCTDFEVIKEYLNKDKIKVVNPLRRIDVITSYKIVQNLIGSQEETTIKVEPGKLDLGDVSIRINALSITIHNLNALQQVFKKADSVDIYPKTDGTVQMDIQFFDVYFVHLIE